MRDLILGAAVLAGLSGAAFAQSAPSITIDNAWARATAGAVPNGAAYVTIIDHGAPDRLVGVSTPIAGMAELHETIQDGDVMKMRPIDGLPIPSQTPVTFNPGGYHIMLMQLKKPLTAGATFPLSLRFQNAGTIVATVTVKAIGASAPTTGGAAGGMPMNMPGMKTP